MAWPSGSPDSTFDGGGKILIGFGGWERAYALVRQPDGKRVAGGCAHKVCLWQITDEGYHIPGATVAIVRDGALFFAKGYGYADLVQQTLKNNTQSLAAWPGEKRPR